MQKCVNAKENVMYLNRTTSKATIFLLRLRGIELA